MRSSSPGPLLPRSSNSHQEAEYHVVFYDTSDDDNSHEASISVLSEPTSSDSPQNALFVRKIYHQCANYLWKNVKKLALSRKKGIRNHPHCPDDEDLFTCDRSGSSSGRSGSESSDGSRFAYGASWFPKGEGPLQLPREEKVVVVNEDREEIDLPEAISQYLRTSDPPYLDVIRSLLDSGAEVDGSLLSLAAGSSAVMKLLLREDAVRWDDSVKEIVQEEVNHILSGDPNNGDYVSGTEVEYLNVLCSVPYVRLDSRQVALLQYSGYLFIEILMDNPHLTLECEKLMSCCESIRQGIYLLCTFLLHIAWIPGVFLFAAIVATTVYWFANYNENKGYYTILCFFIGYIASVLTSIRSEQGKLHSYSRKAEMDYPHQYLILFPGAGLYKILLTLRAFKYDSLADGKRYITIQHDLWNGLTVQCVAEALYSAIPQLILQMLFFSGETVGTFGKICHLSILCLAPMSIACGFCGFIRSAMHCWSCDSFYFAFLTMEELLQRSPSTFVTVPILQTNIMIRIFQLCTVAFCVALWLTMLLDFSYWEGCSEYIIALEIICFAFATIVIFATFVFLLQLSFSRLNVLLQLPVILGFGLLLIYYALIDTNACFLGRWYWSFEWHYSVIIFFGIACITLVILAFMILVESIKGKRIIHGSVKYFFA